MGNYIFPIRKLFCFFERKNYYFVSLYFCGKKNVKLQSFSICIVDKPSCPVKCPSQPHRVCGSDGKTYLNLCRLQQATCGDRNIVLRHTGICGKFWFLRDVVLYWTIHWTYLRAGLGSLSKMTPYLISLNRKNIISFREFLSRPNSSFPGPSRPCCVYWRNLTF